MQYPKTDLLRRFLHNLKRTGHEYRKYPKGDGVQVDVYTLDLSFIFYPDPFFEVYRMPRAERTIPATSARLKHFYSLAVVAVKLYHFEFLPVGSAAELFDLDRSLLKEFSRAA